MYIPTVILTAIHLVHATASYSPDNNQNYSECLTTSEANLLARQLLNITTLPKKDQYPAMQVLALENFTFTSDSISFLEEKPLNQSLTTSIQSFLTLPTPKTKKILWLGHTCDTISIYRDRGIDFMVVDLQKGKLKEWYFEMNTAAARSPEPEYEESSCERKDRPVCLSRDEVEGLVGRPKFEEDVDAKSWRVEGLGGARVLKMAWTCDSVIVYQEIIVQGDVATLPVRGFHAFFVDLISRKIRKVFYEINSGALRYALGAVKVEEPFRVTVGDEGVRFHEYSCSNSTI